MNKAILFIPASANSDDRVFPDADRFDIHRDRAAHCTFGYGIHTCVGNVLARMEGRVFLEELLKRFPEWNVDLDNAELLSTSTVRGWAQLPAYVGSVAPKAKRPLEGVSGERASTDSMASPPETVQGVWTITIKGPTGPMNSTLVLESANGILTGHQIGDDTTTPIDDISYKEGNIIWSNSISKPMKLNLEFSGRVAGNTMTGKVKTGFMGSYPFTGVKNKNEE